MSPKSQTRSMVKIWGSLLLKQKKGATIIFPEGLEDTPFNQFLKKKILTWRVVKKGLNPTSKVNVKNHLNLPEKKNNSLGECFLLLTFFGNSHFWDTYFVF